ncbi:MAG: peroxidase-related enzyme [Deltaproteobacteria bacterium]|nr:peroxidase-related enzyme [Deltaproteobacteria bacterium]
MAHAEFLRQEGGDDLAVEQVKDDWRQMALSAAERAMLEYVEKLTLTPSSMTEADVQKLRDAGWSDRDILDIVHVCAYFNFRVRVVDGLGLELTDWQITRARAGSERAAKLAQERGVRMPSDPWRVR